MSNMFTIEMMEMKPWGTINFLLMFLMWISALIHALAKIELLRRLEDPMVSLIK